jgi:hypothetical protein
MAATRNSRPARTSKRPTAKTALPGGWLAVTAVTLLLACWSAAAIWYIYSHGWLLYYGDAEAHLKIARRIVDSKTPGYDQIGTVWLPLPHALMLPFVPDDGLWRSGLAASIPMGACFVLAGAFLFAAVRRIFRSAAAAAVALVLFAANPNVMYLQSTAMTEAVFFATFFALLFFTVRFRDTQGWGSLVGAGISACLGTLTRYEGWFLLPFAALYLLLAAKQRRIAASCVFCLIAGLGPLYWLAHNWWLTGDALEFFRGPYSPRAIQRSQYYPGKDNWALAWLQFRTAAQLCAGWAMIWMGLAGAIVAAMRRAWWPLLLAALPPAFYVWSMHSSSGTPIFVPGLWPESYYNTRYGLALLPALLLGAAAMVTTAPPKWRTAIAVLVVAAGAMQWAIRPGPDSWITWKESQVNSDARREWTRQAAEYLGERYVPGTGIITSSSDLIGIFRMAGIPLRELLTEDNGLPFDATMQRPAMLRQQWAVVMGGDPVQTAIWKAPRFGIHYQLRRMIVVKGAPVIEIYSR